MCRKAQVWVYRLKKRGKKEESSQHPLWERLTLSSVRDKVNKRNSYKQWSNVDEPEMDVVTVRKDRAMHLERHGLIEVDHLMSACNSKRRESS